MMPFRSQAQAKWAFATKQPWARRWGHKTRLEGGIDKLPQYVARKDRKWGKRKMLKQKTVPSATPALGNASGPGGLFSASGLEKGGTNATTTFRRRAHRIRPERRLRPTISYKSDGPHTGAMIAVYLPLGAAKEIGQAAVDLFAERAENSCELHITLAYLGKMADIDDKLPALVAIVQRYTRTWLETVGVPIPARIGGYRSFDTIQDDGSIPIYREVISPLLMTWVEGLESALAFGDMPLDRQYGPYTPHVTVAYSYPELAHILPNAPATPHNVLFHNITLALGDLRIDLPLALPEAAFLGMKAVASSDSAGHSKPGAPKGKTSPGGHEEIKPGVYRIRGNLCQVHGKFGPCDSASSEGFGKDKKKKGGKGKGGGKPKLSDADKAAKRQADAAQRKAEAEAQRVQNRTQSLAQLAKRPTDQAMAALDTLRQGGAGDPALMASMEATGLVQKHSDGSYTLSGNGHKLLNALDKGDAGAAAEAIAGGGDTVASTAERQAARAASQQKREDAIKAREAAKLAKQKVQAETRAARTAERKKKRANAKKRREDTEPTRNTRQQVESIGDRLKRTRPRNESLEVAT